MCTHPSNRRVLNEAKSKRAERSKIINRQVQNIQVVGNQNTSKSFISQRLSLKEN